MSGGFKQMAKRLSVETMDLSKAEYPSITIERVADSNMECATPIRIELTQNWGERTHSVWIPLNKKDELIKLLNHL